MKRLLLNLSVILSIINAGHSHGISCYHCEGFENKFCNKLALESNHFRYLRECEGDTDRCMRVWQKTDSGWSYIQSTCANERLCDKLEKACDKLKAKGEKCAVGCCHDNGCNVAGSGVYFSLHLFIACIVFGVLQTLYFT